MSQGLLNKINQKSLLSHIFTFLSRKRAIKLLLLNKKLSSELNLTIEDSFLEEKFRKIILHSNGSLIDIAKKSFTCYQESNYNELTFPELVQNIIKYLKFLYFKKVFKYYSIKIDFRSFFKWPLVSFIIEVLRNFKKGISFEFDGSINYKYYDILKDAIGNLDEVHSVNNYLINQQTYKKENAYIMFYDMFDWTKVRCVNLMKFYKFHPAKGYIEKYILIPDNATFRKIVMDNGTDINSDELSNFLIKHSGHIEYLKIFNFSDININTEFFSRLEKIKKVKFIKCNHFIFHNFLIFFKKYLPQIKILVLDEILQTESGNLYEKKEYSYIMENVLSRLSNLEKLELNFTKITNIGNIYKLLTSIISQNENLQSLKLGLKLLNSDEKKKNKSSIFLEQFIRKEKNNTEGDNLKEFYKLIKQISTLKKLSNLEFNFELDDKMSQIVSTFLTVGENLKNLVMTHTKKMNVTQILNSHPHLNEINLCLKEKSGEETQKKFSYEFSQRYWKSIRLKNYPLNDSFIDALISARKSLNDLTLENTVNVCEKTLPEVNNILLAIKNKMN